MSKYDGQNWVGSMDWDACDECKHYPPDTGGCDVNGWDNCEVDGDFVVCRSFEPRPTGDEPEVIDVNPDQMELL